MPNMQNNFNMPNMGGQNMGGQNMGGPNMGGPNMGGPNMGAPGQNHIPNPNFSNFQQNGPNQVFMPPVSRPKGLIAHSLPMNQNGMGLPMANG